MSRFGQWPLAFAFLGLGLTIGVVTQQMIGQLPAPPAQPPVPRESFAPVVRKVLPAVVSIEGRNKPQAKANGKAEEFDPGFGSGVIIDPAGVILTNNHVVQDTDTVDITLQDGRKFVSRDIRRDPKSDLAVIRIEIKEPLPFLELADSDAVEVGDRVLAVGAPFGLTGSVTHGIVSAKGRGNLRLNQHEDWLQTDAAVNPGNSGGPLVNMDGKVIGITAAIKTRSGGFSGVGLAVASNLCRSVSSQLLKDGVVRRGYLGTNLRDLDDALAQKLGVRAGSGALVVKLYDNSPASRAGLQTGDLITSVAGRAVRDGRDVQRVVAGLPIGQAVEVAILRDGQPMVAKVMIEEQPAGFGETPAPQPAAQPNGIATIPFQSLGFAIIDLTPETAARMGYGANVKGVAVLSVVPDTPADRAGLRSGQVIVKADRAAVTSAVGLQQIIARADREKGVLLQVLRPTGEVDFVVLRVN